MPAEAHAEMHPRGYDERSINGYSSFAWWAGSIPVDYLLALLNFSGGNPFQLYSRLPSEVKRTRMGNINDAMNAAFEFLKSMGILPESARIVEGENSNTRYLRVQYEENGKTVVEKLFKLTYLPNSSTVEIQLLGGDPAHHQYHDQVGSGISLISRNMVGNVLAKIDEIMRRNRPDIPQDQEKMQKYNELRLALQGGLASQYGNILRLDGTRRAEQVGIMFNSKPVRDMMLFLSQTQGAEWTMPAPDPAPVPAPTIPAPLTGRPVLEPPSSGAPITPRSASPPVAMTPSVPELEYTPNVPVPETPVVLAPPITGYPVGDIPPYKFPLMPSAPSLIPQYIIPREQVDRLPPQYRDYFVRLPGTDSDRGAVGEETRTDVERRALAFPIPLSLGPVSLVPMICTKNSDGSMSVFNLAGDNIAAGDGWHVGLYDENSPFTANLSLNAELTGSFGENIFQFDRDGKTYYVYQGGVYSDKGLQNGVGMVFDKQASEVRGVDFHNLRGESIVLGYVVDMMRTSDGMIRGYYFPGMGTGISYTTERGLGVEVGTDGIGVGMSRKGISVALSKAWENGGLRPWLEIGALGTDLSGRMGVFGVDPTVELAPLLGVASIIARGIMAERQFSAMLDQTQAREMADYMGMVVAGTQLFSQSALSASMATQTIKAGIPVLSLPGRDNNLVLPVDKIKLDSLEFALPDGRKAAILLDTIEEYTGIPLAQLRIAFKDGAELRFENGRLVGIAGKDGQMVFVSPLMFQPEAETMVAILKENGGSARIERGAHTTRITYEVNGVEKSFEVNRNDEWRMLYPLLGGTMENFSLETLQSARALSLTLYGSSLEFAIGKGEQGVTTEIKARAAGGEIMLAKDGKLAPEAEVLLELSKETAPVDLSIRSLMERFPQAGAYAKMRSNVLALMGIRIQVGENEELHVQRLETREGGEILFLMKGAMSGDWSKLLAVKLDGYNLPVASYSELSNPEKQALSGLGVDSEGRYGIISYAARQYAVYEREGEFYARVFTYERERGTRKIIRAQLGEEIPLSSLSTYYGETTLGGQL